MKTSPPRALGYAEHASDIITTAADLIATGQRFALITSLAIQGGAAREVGSLALVQENGDMTGYLSNGCIDRDIQHHALAALRSGDKKLIRYGDGSRFADLKLPCGGALDVLIDPTPEADAILAAKQDFDARQPANLWFHSPSDAPPMTRHFQYLPPFRLALAGRGAIFRAVARAGQATGFDIYLLSPETEDLAETDHLSTHPSRHLTSLSQPAGLELLDEYSAFMTLFHDHDWEPNLLRASLDTPAHFIGSLGSERTHAIRRETLRQMGVTDKDLQRLHGPIGLVPSLRDAAFIAVSALAEIVAALPPAIQDITPKIGTNAQPPTPTAKATEIPAAH